MALSVISEEYKLFKYRVLITYKTFHNIYSRMEMFCALGLFKFLLNFIECMMKNMSCPYTTLTVSYTHLVGDLLSYHVRLEACFPEGCIVVNLSLIHI